MNHNFIDVTFLEPRLHRDFSFSYPANALPLASSFGKRAEREAEISSATREYPRGDFLHAPISDFELVPSSNLNTSGESADLK